MLGLTVLECILDQIGEGAADFLFAADEPLGRLNLKPQVRSRFMGDQECFLNDGAQQLGNIDGVPGNLVRRRFQSRQGQKVIDQGLHPQRLLLHAMEAPCKGGRESIRLIDHGFDRAADDGQRRPQLMGDVGHEIRSDSLHKAQLRDILGHQQSQIVTVGNDSNVELRRLGDGRGNPDGLVVIPLAKVFGKLGVTNQVPDILADILATKAQ